MRDWLGLVPAVQWKRNVREGSVESPLHAPNQVHPITDALPPLL